MIRFSHECRDGRVFIHCAANETERKDLETVAHQTKTICDMVGNKEKKTGLWLTGEINHNGRLIVIFSLERKVALRKEELKLIYERCAVIKIGGN